MIWVLIASAFLASAGLGAAVRYLTGLLLNNEFPVGTLAINLLGAFLLGLVVGADVGETMSVIVGTGAIGAMSTWSATANEAAVMARRDEGLLAMAYIALTVLSGIMFAWFGLRLGQAI